MRKSCVMAVLLALLVLSPLCPAQSTTSAVLGIITDATGAVVPGVAVQVTNTATGIQYNAKTNGSGEYRVAQLPPGTYTMLVTNPGFNTQNIAPFTLVIDQEAKQNITMSVGQATENVTVSGSSLLLDTDTPNIGQVIENKQIENLPLNGRDFLQLAQLSAGVTPIVPGTSSPASTWTGTSTVSVSIAGLREDDISYLLDGIETRNSWYGAVGILPSVDNIQEFKVEQTGSTAAYGDGGAFINVVSRAGTNQVHGTVYEFIRNNAFDARNYFDVGKAPPFHQNQFGASIGGPIKHDRAFFFLNYEGFRLTQPSSTYNNVPTLAQLQGNFSADKTQLVSPFTGLPYAGNIIPSSDWSKVGQKLLSFYPAPNGVFPGGQNYAAVTNTSNNWDQAGARVDFKISDKDNIFGRYTQQNQTTVLGGITQYNSITYPSNPKNVAFGWNHTFNTNLLNSFRFGWTHSETGDTRAFGFDPAYTDPVGLKNVGLEPGSYGVPRLTVAGYSNPGGATGTEVIRENLFMGTDSLTLQRGKHTITLGTDIRYDPIYLYEDWQSTNLSFNGNYTGDPIADLLVGVPSSGGSANGDPTLNFRRWYQSYYVNDAVQVSKNLNVNVGVRYEYQQPPVDTQNHVGTFDTATGTALTYPQTSAIGLGRQMVHPQYTNVSPRVGFNWSPPAANGSTIIKGGFGIYYLQPNMNQFEVEVDTPKYYSVNFYNNSPAGQPVRFTADQLFDPTLPGAGQSVSYINPNNKTPYTYEYSLSIGQTFFRNWLAEVSYLGSAARHYETRIIANPLLPNDTTAFPGYSGGVQENINAGSSSYNGVALRVEHRYSSGFSLLGAYTYSKCLGTPWQDQFTWHPLNLSADYGHCTYDLNQHLSVSSVYELPFGTGKRFLNHNNLLNVVAGNWQLSGIATFYTGPWITLGSNQNLGNFINALPNVTGPVNDPALRKGLGKNGRLGPYFNTANVHPVTTLGVQGNAGVGNVQAPGAQDWDLSFFKTWTIAERIPITFRSDMFNIFNHANFTNLDSNVNDSNFGNVTGALPAREIQFSLRVSF